MINKFKALWKGFKDKEYWISVTFIQWNLCKQTTFKISLNVRIDDFGG